MLIYEFLHNTDLLALEDAVNRFIKENSKFDPQFVSFQPMTAAGKFSNMHYYAVMTKLDKPRTYRSMGPSA